MCEIKCISTTIAMPINNDHSPCRSRINVNNNNNNNKYINNNNNTNTSTTTTTTTIMIKTHGDDLTSGEATFACEAHTALPKVPLKNLYQEFDNDDDDDDDDDGHKVSNGS